MRANGIHLSKCQCSRMVYVPECLCISVVYVPRCLRANEPKVCFSFLARHRANKHANEPCASVLTQRANVRNGVTIFQTFLLRNAKGNFYTLSLFKKLYILLDIIVIHIICICIINKNCITFHFYTSCHIEEKCVEFLFFIIFFFFNLQLEVKI